MNINNTILLNGNRNIVKDPNEKLAVEKVRNEFNKNKKLIDINVPSNWENQGLHNLNSSVWFIKKISSKLNSVLKNNPSAKKEDLIILCFDGVDYFADVWLNWNYFGKYEGYFSPFSFDKSSSLKEKNILIIKVVSPFKIPEHSLNKPN